MSKEKYIKYMKKRGKLLTGRAPVCMKKQAAYRNVFICVINNIRLVSMLEGTLKLISELHSYLFHTKNVRKRISNIKIHYFRTAKLILVTKKQIGLSQFLFFTLKYLYSKLPFLILKLQSC